MNSIMERWIGSCGRELLDRTLIWNQRHLITVLREYEDFYNTHRPHQGKGMGLRAPDDNPDVIAFPGPVTRIQRQARLAGLINEYRRTA